ncbi:chorismate mutase [Olivibacter domesticus]|uniref:chorismate mutase n=1 Tax=Olivibacter domesticus TaxID=407022 RepID=A0A1H7K9Y9_OLID1|nr:chorismate mutase [Olivibacter domesticus]SEK83320.1 Chorismate mutase [Olivibacter domesticus]
MSHYKSKWIKLIAEENPNATAPLPAIHIVKSNKKRIRYNPKKEIMRKIITITSICVMGIMAARAQDHAVLAQDTMTVYRKKIDKLDKEIIHLLGDRMQAARTIGAYKVKHKVAVVQPDRFNKVLQQAVIEGEKVGLSADFVKKLYEDVHTESVRQEEELKQKAITQRKD